MSETPQTTTEDQTDSDFYFGLLLAISSCIFIGSSFIIKKIGLLRLSLKGSRSRAALGGYGYLKDWVWWSGLICMGIGEACNFSAYAFAPASLVTPLGALSVIVAAVLSSHFLKEKLNLLGKMGCFLCLVGSTIIVIHSPKEKEVNDLSELLLKIKEPLFVVYVFVVLIVSLLIVFHWGPKIGHKSVIVYLVLCSLVGSLTVMSCKALGLAIRETWSGKNDFTMLTPWVLIILTIFFITVQMNYLNKALDIFNTSIVTPIYYVIFTTLVIFASAILFKEWMHIKIEDMIGDLCGFFVVICAVVLLNAFKDMDVSLDDVRGIMRPKRELISERSGKDFTVTFMREDSRVGRCYGTTNNHNI